MVFSIKVVPDAPIVIHTHAPGPLATEGLPEAMQELAWAIVGHPQPVYLILDRTGVRMTSDDLARAAGFAAPLQHPQVIETLMVAPGSSQKAGAMGMPGEAGVRTFDTLDEALDYCREKMAETQRV